MQHFSALRFGWSLVAKFNRKLGSMARLVLIGNEAPWKRAEELQIRSWLCNLIAALADFDNPVWLTSMLTFGPPLYC